MTDRNNTFMQDFKKEALLDLLGEGLQQRSGFKFMNLVANSMDTEERPALK